MLNQIKGLANLNKLRQQASQMQQVLAQEEVTVEREGIKVVCSGDQKIKEIIVDGVLENRIVDVLNEAIKKTQELAAKKLLEISKEG